MALFAKEEKTHTGHATQPAPTPPASVPSGTALRQEASASGEAQAHLGQGSRVEGKLSFEGSVRIDGEVQGEINAKDTVTIGETAVVSAKIHAKAVVLLGRLDGDVAAQKRVELRSPGKLTGNISTPSLVIHEGVVFEGHCAMGAKTARPENTAQGDRKVAIFPKEDRKQPSRMPAEAAV